MAEDRPKTGYSGLTPLQLQEMGVASEDTGASVDPLWDHSAGLAPQSNAANGTNWQVRRYHTRHQKRRRYHYHHAPNS